MEIEFPSAVHIGQLEPFVNKALHHGIVRVFNDLIDDFTKLDFK
jgi:hypothetical protein